MSEFNYNGRTFVGIENYDDGDLTQDTRFHYYQKGDVVWGTYEGGGVQFGTLVAQKGDRGVLDMRWMFLNKDGKFVSGTCTSTPAILADGRYRVHEAWRDDESGVEGTSVIEEIKS